MQRKFDLEFIPSDDTNEHHANLLANGYTGLPCPKIEVVERIGISGVEEIDKLLKEVIYWRARIFGKNSEKSYLPIRMHFFDRNDPKLLISCTKGTDLWPDTENEMTKKKQWFYYPDRLFSDTNYRLELNDPENLGDKIQQKILGII